MGGQYRNAKDLFVAFRPGPGWIAPRGILAPATTELIRVEGDIDYEGPTDKPVRGIAFSGLTFSHARPLGLDKR